MTATALIVFLGVEKGIEKFSRVLMPALLILTVLLSIFVVTRPGAGAGVAYYLKPDFSKLSMMTVLAALGQLFFSMSLAMGIMVLICVSRITLSSPCARLKCLILWWHSWPV